MAVEGATTREVFEAYLEHVLVPTLKSGQVVVMDNLSAPSSYSFPSVNTTYAFAASSGASLTAWRLLGRLPIWGWGFLALSIAVSYSRVYVGVHYPGDVLGGAIVGTLMGYLIASIGARLGKDRNL